MVKAQYVELGYREVHTVYANWEKKIVAIETIFAGCFVAFLLCLETGRAKTSTKLESEIFSPLTINTSKKVTVLFRIRLAKFCFNLCLAVSYKCGQNPSCICLFLNVLYIFMEYFRTLSQAFIFWYLDRRRALVTLGLGGQVFCFKR